MPSDKPQVIVRPTEIQKECWERAAQLAGMSLSSYIRMVMDEDAECADEPTVIKTREDVVAVLAERGAVLGAPSPEVVLPPRTPTPRSAKAGKGKKVVEKGDGRCTAYAAYGTKCKLCGKVHP